MRSCDTCCSEARCRRPAGSWGFGSDHRTCSLPRSPRRRSKSTEHWVRQRGLRCLSESQASNPLRWVHFSLNRRLRRRQNAGGLGRRSAWQRGSCGCRCGNDGSGTEQPTAANFDFARSGWSIGLLVRFLLAHCVLRGCKTIQSERRGLATAVAQRLTIGRAMVSQDRM